MLPKLHTILDPARKQKTKINFKYTEVKKYKLWHSLWFQGHYNHVSITSDLHSAIFLPVLPTE
jgi:hypothetical protein